MSEDEPVYRIEVLVPLRVGDAVIEQVMDVMGAAADTVEKAHPGRDWDVNVAGSAVDAVTVPLAALRELAREATLVAAGFDDLIPIESHQMTKIANLIDALGVEGL